MVRINLYGLEKRFARERNIEQGPKIWQQVVTAIENALNSFERERKSPTVFKSTENGHAMFVRMEFPPQPGTGLQRFNMVRIVYEERQRLITATLNNKPAQKFAIDSDENECFLLDSQGNRIAPDGLSESVLANALFKDPEGQNRQYSEPPYSGGSGGWMAS
jgi:hypothetical protein